MRPLSKDEVDRILDSNLVEEFDKLAATPGYVLTPMPFQRVGLVQQVLRFAVEHSSRTVEAAKLHLR